MIGVIILCVLITLCLVWTWEVYLKPRKYKLPPMHPGVLPISGHLHYLVGNPKRLWNTVKSIAEEATRQGGVITLLFSTKIYYVISDPEDALTAANACLQKHYVYDYAKPWLGEGLITSSGEVWKRHRKLLTPAFSLPVLLNFLEVFNSQSRLLVENLKKHVGKGKFDHTIYLRDIALETFCLTAFGINSFEDKNCIQKYMHAVDKILTIVASRFQNFWLQSDFIFKLSGLKKEHDKYIKIVNDMSDKVIQKKKAELKTIGTTSYEIGAKYKPFLDLLLELSEDNAITDKEIREEVDTAIVTGFDTTSSLLTYIMLLIGKHSEVQDKMYEEIKRELGTEKNVEKEDLQKLVYTEAVIKESLRIFSAAPITLRYVDKDVKLKKYTMQKGSYCVILFYGTHRDPVWGKDAFEFRPERWLDSTLPANPNAFTGFSLGKRNCLGKTYAMISMKTTLVHFLRRYKVTADDSNLQLKMDFMVKPVSGHEISIDERLQS